MMKLTMTVLRRRPNSSAPRSGTTVRSNPTMPPTKALTTISRANWRQFACKPSCMGWLVMVKPEIVALDGLEISGQRWQILHLESDKVFEAELEGRIMSSLSPNRRDGLAIHA